MNIKKLNVGRASRPGMVRGLSASVWSSVAIVAMATASAVGQTEKPGPVSSPLEDTWDYLVELFRMVIGL